MDSPALLLTIARHPVEIWLAGMACGALLGVAALAALRALHHQQSPLRRLLRPSHAPATLVLAMASAALALIAGGALLAEIAESWQPGGAWGRLDDAVVDSLRTHASLAALQWFAVATHLGDSAWLAALTIAVTGALWWRRHRLLAVCWFAALAGNGLLTKVLKEIFARVRPEHGHGLAQADGFSFPSGHSSAGMVAYAMLAYLAVQLLPRRWHLPAAMVAGALIFTTGWSRIVLQVHYASDVLAGWLLGGTWMVCTVLIMEGLSRWRSPALAAAAAQRP